jgi:NTP-dependent ternary system trypsin peptidase co-occuring protein
MDTEPAEGIDLADAIKALRDALVRAMWDGQRSRVRFRVDPVELTVNVAVTRRGGGTAGVKWHILTFAGERSRQLESAQMLKLRLKPVLFDESGGEMELSELLISDRADGESAEEEDRPVPDPA